MNKKAKHIEDLYRDSFSGYSPEPRAGLWRSVSRKLMFREFLSFSVAQFNVYYLGAMVAAGLAGWLAFGGAGNTDIAPGVNSSSEITVSPGKDISNAISVRSSEKEDAVINREPAMNESRKEKRLRLKNEMPAAENARSSMQQTAPLKTRTETMITGAPEEDAGGLYAIPRFSMNTSAGCPPFRVSFYNTSINAESYIWQFGDGASSVEKEPSYIYDEPGRYIVSLTAIDKYGRERRQTDSIIVYPGAEARFEIAGQGAALPDEPVSFNNYSQNAISYEWDFGDGSISSEMEPEHYYSRAGSYNIQLTVWSENSCSDTLVIRNAFTDAGCSILFPNAFRPNINGPSNGYYTAGLTTNEVFHPVHKGVGEYQLRIFNRAGNLIFESNDINIGWDGYINDHLADPGVYIWKARGRYTNGEFFTEFGNVTLVKR